LKNLWVSEPALSIVREINVVDRSAISRCDRGAINDYESLIFRSMLSCRAASDGSPAWPQQKSLSRSEAVDPITTQAASNDGSIEESVGTIPAGIAAPSGTTLLGGSELTKK